MFWSSYFHLLWIIQLSSVVTFFYTAISTKDKTHCMSILAMICWSKSMLGCISGPKASNKLLKAQFRNCSSAHSLELERMGIFAAKTGAMMGWWVVSSSWWISLCVFCLGVATCSFLFRCTIDWLLELSFNLPIGRISFCEYKKVWNSRFNK